MAAPKLVKNLGGAIPTAADLAAAQYDPPSAPLSPGSVAQAVQQLQNTVNALISKFNAHVHGLTVPAEAIWDGAVVSAHATGLSVDVTAGDVVNTDGSFTPVAAVSALALTTADGTNGRLDLIQVATATGVVTKKSGTAAPSPVAPAVDAGNIALATVLVPATNTVPGTITDVRHRPGLDTAGAPTSLIDGTAASATNLFTAS